MSTGKLGKWITSLGVIASLLISLGCSTQQIASRDIPLPVVQWAEVNVWKVLTERGAGSGCWVNDKTLITNCHVVIGEDVVLVQNYNWKHTLAVDVDSCNTDTDIAVLTYNGDPVEGIELQETHLDNSTPREGTFLYGPGYPLGHRLVITTGHLQYKIDKGYAVTVLTIMGDSGSPALMWDGKRVSVIGIRSGIMAISQGWYKSFISHLTLLRPASTVIEELSK